MISIYENRFYLFPYECVNKDEEIVIWGGGKIGKSYCAQLQETNYCKIINVIDKKNSGGSINGIAICKPTDIEYNSNIKVVVSMVNRNAINEVCEFLKSKGISDEMIVTRHHVIPTYYEESDNSNGKVIRYLSKREAHLLHNSSFFDYWDRLNEILKIKKALGYELTRVGNKNDGGYVMLDSFSSDCEKVAYSFGINDDVSWDDDMAKLGYQVYQYDHTIDRTPYDRPEFKFFRIGISEEKTPSDDGMLDTMEDLIKRNGHIRMDNMVLKMDVEGAEYGFIKYTSEDILKKFNQIVLECHSLNDVNKWGLISEALKKITEIFAVVHIHANNFSSVVFVEGVPYPDTLEITFINRKRYKLRDNSNEKLPLDIDNPCDEKSDEIVLGEWNSR